MVERLDTWTVKEAITGSITCASTIKSWLLQGVAERDQELSQAAKDAIDTITDVGKMTEEFAFKLLPWSHSLFVRLEFFSLFLWNLDYFLVARTF
jgi:hypothetical protein